MSVSSQLSPSPHCAYHAALREPEGFRAPKTEAPAGEDDGCQQVASVFVNEFFLWQVPDFRRGDITDHLNDTGCVCGVSVTAVTVCRFAIGISFVFVSGL